MECWVLKGNHFFIDTFNLYFKIDFASKTPSHFPRTHYSIIPVFQHSKPGPRMQGLSVEERCEKL